MKKKNRIEMSTTQAILLSFLAVILLGSLLLMLPVSVADGKTVSYLDALFTATTATCVTGLVTLPTVSSWSVFGQVVILILIQIGGLGVITVMSGVMLLLNRKMGIGNKLLLQDALNLNTMSGLLKFVKNVLIGSLAVELTGAVLYMLVFVPDFGLKGIWISVFTAVSAFCNAGMDILGTDSLCSYAVHPLINMVTSCLIVLGGLGYIVWWDVIRVFRMKTKRSGFFKYLTLHSKIALCMTFGLIIGGALFLFLFEYANPLTIGNMAFFDKIQVSLFQSITTRTAGFASVAQEHLTDASIVVCLVLMLIGGSPVGTAGGIKTVTIAVLFFTAFATIRGKDHVSLFGRRISDESIKKANAVTVAFLTVCFVSTLLLVSVERNADVLDLIYEAFSASATVGLSRNLTGNLSQIGKLILIATMYFGRVGPISLAVALGRKKTVQNLICEPIEEISIG